MTEHFSDPDQAVGELTTIIEDFITIFIRLPLVERLSFTTLSVLHTLARRGPMRLTELTATEQMTQPAITQMVRRLEEDGLLERRADVRDGRVALIQLTPRGAQIVEARRTARVERLSGLLERLSAEEREAIVAAVPALAHAIELERNPVLPLHPHSSQCTEQAMKSPTEQE